MSDELKQAEKRGYSRGYQAGRKKVETDAERAEGLFRQQVFCAALQGTMVRGGWQTGDVTWKTGSDYIRGCKNIADEAVRKFCGQIVA